MFVYSYDHDITVLTESPVLFFRMLNSYKILIVLIILFLTVTMTGCTKSASSASPASPPLADIDTKISQSVDLSNVQKCDSEKLEKYYGVNADELEDFVLYTPAVNIKADEMAIFKVKDETGISDMQNRIEKRLQNKTDSFKEYLPEEYYLVEKHVLVNHGNYVLFAISKDAETIEDIFNEFF
ncbi:MAG: DUF4358 domain-containing protein [Bacillota bacterium]|nr:DUF4358 domain-containing protein [Bacillota bacterium]